ncbi:MAG: hypothetical protein JOY81_10400 [Alphaproteobacteria bacterium]|nr:hypothetical protein [Alphaproteobacteria bacterium]
MTNLTNRTSAIAVALVLAAAPVWAQTSTATPGSDSVVTPEVQQDPHARSVRHSLKLDPVAPLQGAEQKPAASGPSLSLGPLRDGPPQTVGPDRIAGPAWTMGPLKVAGPAQLDGPLASSGPVTK